MANEISGKLTRKTIGGKVDWSLNWTDQKGKPRTLGHGPVFRLLTDEIRAFRANEPAVTIPVLLTMRFDNPAGLAIADDGLKADIEQNAALAKASEEAERARRRDEAIAHENAKGEPFGSPASWNGNARQGYFHNPYNFVPGPEGAPPVADAANALDARNNPLGHYAPAGHHAYHPDLWSGCLKLQLAVKTPLLMLDTPRKIPVQGAIDHWLYPILKDALGKPVIPVTSFKGVLRSAYEAITNSRMGVFTGHSERLGRRMDARAGLSLIPARINSSGNSLELMMGTSAPSAGAKPSFAGTPPVMHAAWLPRYNPGRTSASGPVIADHAIKPKDGSSLIHKQPVKCWIMRVRKSAKQSFDYWRVEEIAPESGMLSAACPDSSRLPNDHAYVEPRQSMQITGVLSLSGQSFGRKHDERVFFTAPGTSAYSDPAWADAFPALAASWKSLVLDYREVHKKELAARKKNGQTPDAYLGKDPGKTAFSRHVYADGAETLKAGDLCYAQVDAAGKVTALYPVMISRELGELPPENFISANIRPAEDYRELSPADRVFGWVSQKGSAQKAHAKGGRNMHRGQLRIRRLDFDAAPDNAPAIADFSRLDGGKGLPLAILGQPKPQQARFYLSQDKGGAPIRDGGQPPQPPYSAAALAAGVRLRGRKMFPHHQGAAAIAGYWDGPAAFASPQAQLGGRYYREYVRTSKERDNQNRSISGWINPGVTFTAEIDVINLNVAELGALAWLLSRDDGHFLRLGHGKPLGFGSVTAKITGAELRRGSDMAADYKAFGSFAAAEISTVDGLDAAIDAYKSTFANLFAAKDFDANPVIKAFVNASRGIDEKPVHYPRAGSAPVQPNPKGESFQWFVANAKTGRDVPAPRQHALDPLWAPTGLPALPAP